MNCHMRHILKNNYVYSYRFVVKEKMVAVFTTAKDLWSVVSCEDVRQTIGIESSQLSLSEIFLKVGLHIFLLSILLLPWIF